MLSTCLLHSADDFRFSAAFCSEQRARPPPSLNPSPSLWVSTLQIKHTFINIPVSLCRWLLYVEKLWTAAPAFPGIPMFTKRLSDFALADCSSFLLIREWNVIRQDLWMYIATISTEERREAAARNYELDLHTEKHLLVSIYQRLSKWRQSSSSYYRKIIKCSIVIIKQQTTRLFRIC